MTLRLQELGFKLFEWLGGLFLIGNSGKQFIGLSSFEMLAMFRRGLFYAYLTIYLRHYLGLSVTATTLFATLPMVVNILSQNLIWGRISDHFQIRRALIIAGEVLASLGTVGVWYLHRLHGDPFTAGYFIIFGLTADAVIMASAYETASIYIPAALRARRSSDRWWIF